MAFVPGEKDPCDFLLQAGADAFRKVLEEARDVMDYTWDRLVEQIGKSNTLTDRTEAMTQFLKNVASGLSAGKVDSLSRTLLLTRLSSLLGLSAGRVETELKKFMKKTTISATRCENKGPSVNYIIEAQREILEVLLNEPGLLAEQEGKIRIEFFTDSIFREIAELLLGFLEEGAEPTLAQLCGRTESPETARWIVELQQSGAERGNYRDRLHQAVEVLWTDIRIREKEKAKAQLKEEDSESLRKISEILQAQKGNPRSGVLKP
jgi:DNA primase